MNIHIAPVGKETNHILVAFKELKGFDQLYLITGKKFKSNAEEIREKLSDFGVECFIDIVDPFQKDSLQKILNYIVKVVKKHKQDEIYINITGGTNLMGAAALSAAYFTKSNAYYVLDSRLVKKEEKKTVMLPIPKISFFDALTNTQKEILLEIVNEIKKNGPINNIKDYSNKKKWSQQRIKPHLDALERMGLLKIDKSKKEHIIELTESTEIILEFLK